MNMAQYDSPDESTIHLENLREEATNLRGEVAELKKADWTVRCYEAEEQVKELETQLQDCQSRVIVLSARSAIPTREKWCAEVEKNLLEKQVTGMDLHMHLTILLADEYHFYPEQDVTVFGSRGQFLSAILHYNRPSTFSHMEHGFTKPACITVRDLGIPFRKYNLYVVPMGENYLIYQERI